MKIPKALSKAAETHPIAVAIDEHHRANQSNGGRYHMGCSQLGHACDRWLWLSFRWAVAQSFDGRILRLFRRGQNEEEIIISDLKRVGMHVIGQQRRVDFGAHVSGSIDGMVKQGVPDFPNVPHLVEFKTHSLKSFTDLKAKGVQEAKNEHYVQMQVYMLGCELPRALYIAVCKNNDEYHIESIKFDRAFAEKHVARGRRLTLEERMPPPLSVDPSWFECKFCPAYSFCHSTKLTTEANCRTCAHSTPKDDSTWHCAHWDAAIPSKAQKAGCESHILHPDLTPWKYTPAEHGVIWHTPNGDIKNGEGSFDTFTSAEIVANPKACASGDRFVEDMREMFGAKMVG